MKVKLLSGKYYRREGGELVKHSAGDVLEVSPAEARRLHVERLGLQRTKRVSQDVPVVSSSADAVVDGTEAPSPILDDEALLDKHVERRSGSWFFFHDGAKYLGRTAAVEAARALEE